MPTDAATVIAYVGAGAGLVGLGISLFNARKAVCWKRAELANTYMKDFNNNPELVFAGRCLDWQGGKLIVPESLRGYLPDGVKTIDHDRRIYAIAVSPALQLGDMYDDPRVQIYRTSLDMFLSWLALVASALDRRLFLVADIHDVGYWVAKIESEVVIHPFIVGYGYATSLQKLIRLYRNKESDYKNWVFPTNMPPRRKPSKAAAEAGT
jgi:hypothetical protein